MFLPARDAGIPDLVGDDDLSRANGLVLGSSYGTIPFGAALFGLAGLFETGRAEFVARRAGDSAAAPVGWTLLGTARAPPGG